MKINVKIKRNLKEVTLRDIPVYDGRIVKSFKRVDVNSENGSYDDAVMTLCVNDSDVKELNTIGTLSVEKSYKKNVIYKKDIDILTTTGGYLFLRYPLSPRILTINSVSDYTAATGTHYYEVLLAEKHGIAPGDYDCNTNLSISVLDGSLNKLFTTYDVFVDGGSGSDDVRKLYINVPGAYAPESGYFLSLNFDPIVYNDLASYGGDWHFYGENGNCSEETEIKFVYENSNICVPVSISSDTDYMGLKQNEIVDDYYKKLTKDIIPGFINPEKTKFVPFLYSQEDNATVGPAMELEFDLHFRKRQVEPYYDDNGDAHYDVGAPTKSWSIETEETMQDGDVHYWNMFEDYNKILESDEHWYVGDLVGFLGFTDDDILNRKKKVKQSFLRISFYSSNNPLQTSMLFYSTVFLDANSLYSKYIKLYTSPDYEDILDDYLISEERGDSYENGWGLVFFDGKPKKIEGEDNPHTYSFSDDELLRSTITVTSENDKSSSAEGFNLYLFSDDAPKDGEEYVIYMKIEFNHAGYGRTFPMILWPKDKEGLTRENYYENLYIPVVIRRKDGQYYYYIERAKNDLENKTIKFALFEPKIEPSSLISTRR